MFRRCFAERGFDEHYRHLVDLEMWFHLLEQGSLVNLPAPLAMIRRHATQATRDNALAGHIITDKKRLYAEYGRRPYVIRAPWQGFRWRLRTAYNAWDGGPGRRETPAVRPSEIVHPLIFYPLLPAMMLLERVRDALGRWRARRHGRSEPHRGEA